METKTIINNTDSTNTPINKNHLTASFNLILHTQAAQALFNGKWQFGRMGLLQFAKTMSVIWKAFKQDDPYAEWHLLKTYEAIEESRMKLKVHESNLQQQIDSLRGIEASLFKNDTPLKCPLRFSTPYPFMAAMLIEQVDYVNRQLLTLQRLGLVPKENLLLKDLMREVQSVFRLPRAWRYTGVTRDDILAKNQKAQQVIQLLGEVPTAVLNKEVRFAFLPKLKWNEYSKQAI